MLTRLMTLLLLFIFVAIPVDAAEEQFLGDWAGLRTALDKKGITAEAVLTTDFMYNTRGGIDEDGTILGNFDLTFEMDTEKAEWWENGTFFLYFLGNFNSNGLLTDIVGDVQTSSNIEADEAVRLFEAWYEHRFLNDNLALLFGLHDLNSEFDVLEYASLFINSSFGISPDISQTGPSIFPTSSVAVRLRVLPTENSYLLGAVYDGVPGDPDDPPRTTVKLEEGDGIFAVVEAGLTDGEPGTQQYYKLAAGAWLHTADVENFDGKNNDRNNGVYLIAEKTLFEEAVGGQGLGVFMQLGFADDDWNQITNYWGLGVHYIGLIPGRNSDVAGLAVACARNGDKFMKYMKEVEMTDVDHTETAIEFTYRAEIKPWFILQPDVQYIINPSMDPSLRNALQVGVRLEWTF
jgi:porin